MLEITKVVLGDIFQPSNFIAPGIASLTILVVAITKYRKGEISKD